MLVLDIGSTEALDEKTNEFVRVPGTLIELEHSLVSLSKWESFFEKPFLSPDQDITADETIEYIKMMTLTPNVSPKLYTLLDDENIREVNEYLKAKMTATWFNDPPGPSVRAREVITAEIIYYWLVALNIPFEPCQNWHLNRLLTLVKVCNQKNQPAKPKKKFSAGDLAARGNLNAMRKAQMNTNG